MIPELHATGTIRIPPNHSVPITPRIRRIIDSEPFRRLASIPQLGFVHLVYPGARHSRFEHSLGVYRLALKLLKQPRLAPLFSPNDAESFILAALLHDLGHYPFAHLVEDLGMEEIPHHETLAQEIIQTSEIADLLKDDWNSAVCCLPSAVCGVAAAALSGPVDIDKMDYLYRDSLHAGVPYGMQFDQNRLIASLCLNEAGDGLAITEKGKTAAELMIFARYVMFSEVYWHHAVRAASVMFQTLFRELYHAGNIDFLKFAKTTEHEAVSLLRQAAQGTNLEPLAEGLFGPKRRLYKRIDNLNAESAERRKGGENMIDILIDRPPVRKEIEMNIDVLCSDGVCRPLASLSPAIKALATEQFDQHVKKVRFFKR